MGRHCGYLALMSGLATGAERVYMHEEGVTLQDLQVDVENLNYGFQHGKRLGLMIRNEYANQVYTHHFMCSTIRRRRRTNCSMCARPSSGTCSKAASPFDRIQATRLATRCIDFLIKQAENGSNQSAFIGLQGKEDLNFTPSGRFSTHGKPGKPAPERTVVDGSAPDCQRNVPKGHNRSPASLIGRRVSIGRLISDQVRSKG